MDVSDLIPVIIGPDRSAARGKAPPVTPGEHLAGRIQALREDGIVLVDFGRFQATALIQASVRVGDTIAVEVVETGNPMKFRMVPPREANRPEASLPRLPNPERVLAESIQMLQADASDPLPKTIRLALKELQSRFQPLNPAGDRPVDLGQRLQAAVADSGLFFEKKAEAIITALLAMMPDASDSALAAHQRVQGLMATDMKPVLFRLLTAFGAGPTPLPGTTKGLIQAASHLLARIQTIQQALGDRGLSAGTSPPLTYLSSPGGFPGSEKRLAGLKPITGPPMPLTVDAVTGVAGVPAMADAFQAITFPLSLAGANPGASLRVFYRKKREKPPETDFRLSLLLHMEHLGGIRADFHQAEKNLTLAIFTEQVRTRELMERHLATLKEALVGRFDGLAVTVSRSERKAVQFENAPTGKAFGAGINLRV